MSSRVYTRDEVRADIERILEKTNDLLKMGGFAMTKSVAGDLFIVSVGTRPLGRSHPVLGLAVYLKHLSMPIKVWELAEGTEIEARTASRDLVGTIADNGGVLGFTLHDLTSIELSHLEFRLKSLAME